MQQDPYSEDKIFDSFLEESQFIQPIKSNSISAKSNRLPQYSDDSISQNKQPKKLKYAQEHTYSFPVKLLHNQIIKAKSQFKKLMIEEANGNGFDKGWSIRKHKYNEEQKQNQYRIYVRCSKCKANIHYHQNPNSSWTLLNFSNCHYHPILNKKAYQTLTQLAISENLLLPNSQLCQTINQSYPMSRSSIIKKKKDILKGSNFQTMKQMFEYLDYDYRYEQNSADKSKAGYPQSLVAASIQQKTNYRKYGQCISYDITYNCIRQVAYNGKRFGVGLFSGFDNNNRILIFGFSITTFQTIQDFKKVFRWFFDLMGYTHTTAIITDQQQSIISALKELKQEEKYKYHHVYDNWHFLRSFKNAMKNQPKEIVNDLGQILRRIMKESDPNIGQHELNLFKNQMIAYNLRKQYDRIQNKLEHICLWKMPNQFIGLSLHSNESLNNLLKLKVEYEITLYEFVDKVDKVSKQRNSKCLKQRVYESYPFHKHYNDPKIIDVQTKYQSKVFNTFIYNYNKSQFYKFISEKTFQYKLWHVIDEDQYFITENSCSCGFQQKTGIPCQHLIYVHRWKNPTENYLSLFHKRWIPTAVKEEKIMDIGGRRKRTRRNYMH